MKKIILVLLMFLTTLASGDSSRYAKRYEREEMYYQAVVLFYAVDEPFLRTLRRYESGAKRNEMGYESRTSLEGYGNFFMCKGGEQWTRSTLAYYKALQKFVLYENDWRRHKFFEFWSEYYHAGGHGKNRAQRAKNNKAYARQFNKIWHQEVQRLRQRSRRGGYSPLKASDEVSAVKRNK